MAAAGQLDLCAIASGFPSQFIATCRPSDRKATTLYLEELPAVIKGHHLVTMFSIPAHA
jgi:hypothetical protein